tara:strand:- start:18289 stop:18432 length:144 start_codon:yes stop_codon:yes gene_type:complete
LDKKNKRRLEIVCPSCQKNNYKNMLEEAEKALLRFNKKIKKRLEKIK